MSIIKPKPLNVQIETPTKAAKPTIGPAIIKARADSVCEAANVLPTSFLDGEPMEAKLLKQHISFRALMEVDGHHIQQSGKYAKCRCPFHPDKTPSFCIFDSDDYAKCYGCNWQGDIFKYEADSHEVDFKQAWKSLNAFLRQEPRVARTAKPASKKETSNEKPQFTPKQLEERKSYAERLATESWLADLVVERRFQKTGDKWKPETIQLLAKEGSLGWAAGALAFIYPRGTKYRNWPGKEFIWESDGSSLWRGEKLAEAKHVYLTESETDAVALLDAGIEQKVPGSVVVALSGVNSFPTASAKEFKDKIVTFCFDNDKAGETGVGRIAPLLAPYAKELRFVDLKEVA